MPDKGVNPADALHIDLLREHLSQNADSLTPELRQVEDILRQGLRYPVLPLKELIIVNDDRIKPSTLPDTEFTVLGVSKQTGVFVNEKLTGDNIKQSYFSVLKNQFCYNPYRINVGSIGLCELAIENQIISGAYNIFGCNENTINPKYLDALFHTKKFLDYVNEKAIGGVRMDFKIEYMKEWQIPVPPLEIQNEIVEKIERQKEIIRGAEILINAWHPYIDESVIKKSLKDFIIDSLYGISTPLSDEVKYPVLRMNNLDTQGNWHLDDMKYIDTPIKTERKLEKGDFIFNRTNSKELVGKSAVVDFDFDGTWAGYLIRLRFNSDLSPFYLRYLFAQKKYRNFFSSIGKQAGGQANINAAELAQTTIDWYPIDIQRQIVERLDRQMAALENVRYLKSEAEKRIEEILAGVWNEKDAVSPLSVAQKENIIRQIHVAEEKATFKRMVLANHIVNNSLKDKNFGNVKFEKLLYLADCFAIKRNLGQKYFIQAAGPYDNTFTKSYFTKIEEYRWFKKQKQDTNQFVFIAGEENEKSLKTYNYFSKDELERVNTLIGYFKQHSYEQPEIIATLYAVWNNRIIRQEPITDALLKQDFLNWDAQKAKYKDRLDAALQWMREKSIIPDGWGEVIERVEKKTKKT